MFHYAQLKNIVNSVQYYVKNYEKPYLSLLALLFFVVDLRSREA